MNLGNPVEYTVKEVAGLILKLSASVSALVHNSLPEDDPKHRCLDIFHARKRF